jgi:hypothetical protein
MVRAPWFGYLLIEAVCLACAWPDERNSNEMHVEPQASVYREWIDFTDTGHWPSISCKPSESNARRRAPNHLNNNKMHV